MKVLVINTRYRVFGGEDSNIHDEIELLKKKYEVSYLEFKNSDKIKVIDLISFISSNNKNSNEILIKRLDEFNPDIVYIHNTWFKANLGIFKILKKRDLIVFHKLHNYRYHCTNFFLSKNHFSDGNICYKCGSIKKPRAIFNKYFQDSYLKSLVIFLYNKKFYKILFSYPIKILVMNEFHKKFLIKLGMKDKKIGIFYNPIEINKYPKNTYDPKSKTVVYAGRLTEGKGLIDLLETWTSSATEDLKLIIIGSGDLQEHIKEKYKSNNITFTGPLSKKETLDFVMQSRAVITCTKSYEGHPRILSEASSFGVPSIYPSFGGMNEYFPSNYPLTFEQFNYKELKYKIESLHDVDLMKNLSEKVYFKSYDLLNEKSLLNRFQELVSSYE
tara:strand:+ start:3571 stop:4728 length:1158 start_codon:yes stop_codon:yes gene_type:complete